MRPEQNFWRRNMYLHHQDADAVGLVDGANRFVPLNRLQDDRSATRCRCKVGSEGSPGHREKDKVLLPGGPIQRIVHIVRWLRQQYSLGRSIERQKKDASVLQGSSTYMPIFGKPKRGSIRTRHVQKHSSFCTSLQWECINPRKPVGLLGMGYMVCVWLLHDL